jgi:hypothetical protein
MAAQPTCMCAVGLSTSRNEASSVVSLLSDNWSGHQVSAERIVDGLSRASELQAAKIEYRATTSGISPLQLLFELIDPYELELPK